LIQNGTEKPTDFFDEYFTQDEAAAAIGKNGRTLGRWDDLGKGPPVTYIGRTPYYNKLSFRRWIAEQERPAKRTEPPRRRGRPRKKPLVTDRGVAAAPLHARSE
jgi:hypothetical protein